MSQGGAVTGVYNTNQVPWGVDPDTWKTYDKSLQIYTPLLSKDEVFKKMALGLTFLALILIVLHLLVRSKKINVKIGIGLGLVVTAVLGLFLERDYKKICWYANRTENAKTPDPKRAAVLLKRHPTADFYNDQWGVCETIDYWYYMDNLQIAEAATLYNQMTGRRAKDIFESWKDSTPCQIGQNDKIKAIVQSILDRF